MISCQWSVVSLSAVDAGENHTMIPQVVGILRRKNGCPIFGIE